jgi:hypothetical protein
MPADPSAVMALFGEARIPTDIFSNSVVAGSSAAFPFLGDTMVLPRPLPFANVFSIGDVLIGLGGASFLVRSMGRRHQSGSRPGLAQVSPGPGPVTESMKRVERQLEAVLSGTGSDGGAESQ